MLAASAATASTGDERRAGEGDGGPVGERGLPPGWIGPGRDTARPSSKRCPAVDAHGLGDCIYRNG